MDWRSTVDLRFACSTLFAGMLCDNSFCKCHTREAAGDMKAFDASSNCFFDAIAGEYKVADHEKAIKKNLSVSAAKLPYSAVSVQNRIIGNKKYKQKNRAQ